MNDSQGTILLVEDDRNDVFFLQYAFETAGITNPMQVVVDGQEAIQYLAGQGPYADRSRYPLPCLVLLDLKLPVRMGLEVLEWIHARPELRNLLVVVLTSSSSMADVDRSYQLGARSFLVKPLSVDKRLEMARLIKEYWIEMNKAPSRGGCTTPQNPTTSARAGHAGGTSPGG
ncbi:MAG TPA: response regulator [Verrucomicrobiae bacterium]|nr:response regulator [Verrucomicrobiae bacterium]